MMADEITVVDELVTRLYSAAGSANPYPLYDALRQLGPVVRTSRGEIIVLGYDACTAALRDQSLGVQNAAWRDQATARWREHPAYIEATKFMLLCDPPDHTRLRAGFGAFFSAGRVKSFRPVIERVTAELLSELAEALRQDAVADFVDLIATPLPLFVIGELIGVPRQDCQWLSSLLTQFAISLEYAPSPAQLKLADDATVTVSAYLTELLAKKRKDSADDAMTSWIAAADNGSDLTIDDVLNAVPVLFAAGVGPARLALGNALSALAAYPDQTAELRDNPALGGAAADELMRFDTPVQMVSRIALRAATIAGVDVHPGEVVHLFLGSANRDPAKFDRANLLDIRRQGTRPLSYGYGIHRCLGSTLASLETAALLPELLARFPALHLADKPARYPGLVFRGFLTMPVAA